MQIAIKGSLAFLLKDLYSNMIWKSKGTNNRIIEIIINVKSIFLVISFVVLCINILVRCSHCRQRQTVKKLPQSTNKYKKILVRKNVFLILTCFVKSPDFSEYFKLPILFIFIVTLTPYSLFYLKVGRL